MLRYLSFALFVVFLTSPFSFAQEPKVADVREATESQAIEPSEAPCSGCGEDLISEHLKDPGFARFVSAEDIRDAIESLDAGWMTDNSLAMAEAERILMREHRSGLTSTGLMETAGKIAVEMGDKDSLQRLAKAATASGQTELATKFSVASQTAGAARAGEPDMGDAAYIVWALRQAIVRGDQEQIRWLVAHLPADLTPQQLAFIEKLVAGSRSSGTGKQNITQQVLGQISSGSRADFDRRSQPQE